MTDLPDGVINDTAALITQPFDPRPNTTLFVTHYGSIDMLQATLDELPALYHRSAVVEPGDNGEARIVIDGDPGFIKFCLDRQGYARIVRILERHGPSTAEIPVTR